MIDLHAHILPGLDDGPEEPERALDMLAIAEADGIELIAATPHYIPGHFAPPAEAVRQATRDLNRQAENAGLSIRVTPGHEIHAVHGIMKRLREGEILAYDARQRYLLVEMPAAQVPVWIDQLLFELEIGGVVPVLAHPERNLGVLRNPVRLFDLVQKGFRVQATADSLGGRFGTEVKDLTERLLDHDLVHVFGSDAHDALDRRPVLSAAYAIVSERRGRAAAEALFRENPRRILAGEELETPEPRAFDEVEAQATRRSLWRSLFGGKD